MGGAVRAALMSTVNNTTGLGGRLACEHGYCAAHHIRKRISTFLRSRRHCWKSHVLASARKSRTNDEKDLAMSVGLIALLDDLAAIAKVAAAYLDDVASQAAKAGVKAAGVVIDDTAVTPGYVIG